MSTAVFLRGKMAQDEWIAYAGVQIVGGVVAAVAVIILGYDADDTTAVAGAGKLLLAEFLFTFALAYVVLNVATRRGRRGTRSTGSRSASLL